MSNFLLHLKRRMTRFHEAEAGLNTLEVVLILALGAIAAVAVYQFGQRAVDFLYSCFYGRIDGGGD